MRIILFILFIQSLAAVELKEYYFDVNARSVKLPIKVYLQTEAKSKPLIVYSHGLGGSRETKKYLLEHWAKAGFICVSVQHPGSDETVWKNAARGNRLKAMKDAASIKQFQNRTKDIPAALDQLEQWLKDPNHPLHGKVDMKKIGMSGHSFGAITSQAMMGTKYPGNVSFEEKRFLAFLLMSPSKVPLISDQSKAFGHIKKAVFCMTGTKDSSVIKPGIGYEERLAVYKALQKGDKYLYVFDGGKHNLFSGPTCFSPKLLEQHKTIQGLSLNFFKAYLLQDNTSKQTLSEFKASGKDHFEKK